MALGIYIMFIAVFWQADKTKLCLMVHQVDFFIRFAADYDLYISENKYMFPWGVVEGSWLEIWEMFWFYFYHP